LLDLLAGALVAVGYAVGADGDHDAHAVPGAAISAGEGPKAWARRAELQARLVCSCQHLYPFGMRLCYPSSTYGSIRSMKVSVSLPEEDVDFLDSYAHAQGIASRSAAVHKAVGLLRATQLGEAYEEAWDTWEGSDDASAWDSAAADGLGN
jgi:Arc/MetJ-type ribon-helix-helix transcriptional regulator